MKVIKIQEKEKEIVMSSQEIEEQILSKFDEPTPDEHKQYRIGTMFSKDGKQNATILTYVDARYVMKRLDEVVGKSGWSNKFYMIGDNLYCTIYISYLDEETGRMVEFSKTDVGMPSEFEKDKGHASDAFKRSAVHLGIGRDLYECETYFVSEGNGLKKAGKSWKLEFDWKPPKKSSPKLVQTPKKKERIIYTPTDEQISLFLGNLNDELCPESVQSKAQEWLESEDYTEQEWNEKFSSLEDYVNKQYKKQNKKRSSK